MKQSPKQFLVLLLNILPAGKFPILVIDPENIRIPSTFPEIVLEEIVAVEEGEYK